LAEILRIEQVSKHFGGVKALNDISFKVNKNEIIGIIGPNGAGKTTLLSLIAGTQKPTKGQIMFGNHSVQKLRPYQVTRLGIARTYQVPRPFAQLSVSDNIRVSSLVGVPRSPWGHKHVEHILNITGLESIADRPAGSLGLLQLKRLELAKALATSPKILLLDEIGSGLTDDELKTLIDLIRNIRDLGITMMLVEHIIDFIVELSDRVVVLDMGQMVTAGVVDEIMQNPVVIRAYLGQKGEDAAKESGQTTAAVPKAKEKEISPPSGRPIINIQGIKSQYGSIGVLNDVNIEVKEGEVVTILGLNGAGKSTLCKVVLGMVPVSGGTIKFDDSDITSWPVHKRVSKAGIALCPEGRQVFRNQSVLENLLLAGDVKKKNIPENLDRVMNLFPELAERKGQMAGTLSGGQQQMLAIARSLMSGPRLLFIDEASLGLTPEVVWRIWEVLGQLQDSGLTLIIIEQRVNESLEMAQRAYVLDRGRVVFSGTPQTLQEGGMLKKMYFGS